MQARAAADSYAVTSGPLGERLQTLLQGSPPLPRSWDSRRQQTPLPLRLVRAQLLDAFEVARLDAGHVRAAEARAVEAHAGELRSGHGGLQVGQVLVQQPVAADDPFDLRLDAAVGDQFLRRRHVDAVDVRVTHRRRRAEERRGETEWVRTVRMGWAP